MNTKGPNQAHLDALWKAYIDADPDMRRMERRKQTIERRRNRKALAMRAREEAALAIIHDIVNTLYRALLCVVVTAVFMLLLIHT